MSSLLRGVTRGCVLIFAASIATAQEGAAPAADPAAAFKEANAAWDALTADIKKIVGEYRTATEPAAREKIKKQYDELAASGPARLVALRTAALAAYKAAPNADPIVTTAAVRMLADDVRRDDYESAAALAKLLLDNKCPDKMVNNFAGVVAYGRDDFEAATAFLEQAEKDQTLDRSGAQCLDDVAAAKLRFTKEMAIREKEAKADDLPRVKLETSKGNLTIELFENQAPETVGNFISLVEAKYYDGLSFHRVLPGFMAQGGCPEGTGTGGPGYKIFCECSKPEFRRHFRGTLSMAHAGENTGGSQFFLTFRSTPHLDGRHTAFGRVIEGLEILTKLQRIDPNSPQGEEPDRIVKATVIRKRDHKYEPHKTK